MPATLAQVLARIRPHLQHFTPYSSARSLVAEAAGIMLDANENPHNLHGGDFPIHRYPEGANTELRTLFAATLGLGPESCFAGHGSDEAIDLLVRLFCTPGQDAVVHCRPTYGMYAICARQHDVQLLNVPLDDNFDINLPALLQATAKPSVQLLFLCSPNNPSGNLLSADRILALLEQRSCVVVLDQAYIDFAQDSVDWPARLAQYPNLVLLRTLSKAWSLAGARVGFALAHPAIIQCLQAIKPPYNLSRLTTRAAVRALDKHDAMRMCVKDLIGERKRLETNLQHLPGVKRLLPSDANFISLEVDDAPALVAALRAKKIIVRDRSTEPGMANCIRISVGTEAENGVLLRTLSSMLGN